MATFTKTRLSGSTNGRGIAISNTATVGNTIHATGTSSSILDEIWLYAMNVHSASVLLTVEFGGTTTTSDLIQTTVTSQSGLTLIVPGLILNGTGSAATTVTAFANTASKIEIFGFVNRIS